MYERVVIPLDSSKLAEQAIASGEEMARLRNVPVTLIEVIDLNHLDHYGLEGLVGAENLADQLAVAERAARDYLNGIASGLKARGRTVTVTTRCGDPASELIAATKKSDLIVMSTHGRTGISRALLGSVAEAVVRRSNAPVYLVRVADQEEAPPEVIKTSDIERLLQQDHYRPNELARILSMDEFLVRQAALSGKLPAQVLNHHVISISRSDALNWLRDRQTLS